MYTLATFSCPEKSTPFVFDAMIVKSPDTPVAPPGSALNAPGNCTVIVILTEPPLSGLRSSALRSTTACRPPILAVHGALPVLSRPALPTGAVHLIGPFMPKGGKLPSWTCTPPVEENVDAVFDGVSVSVVPGAGMTVPPSSATG